MSNTESVFRIDFPAQILKTDEHPEIDILVEELSALEYALCLCEQMYYGKVWHIQLNDQKYDCYFEDITMFWDDLPRCLQQINEGNGITRIEMLEQGTELLIIVEPDIPGYVLISIIIGSKTVDSYLRRELTFDELQPQRVKITKESFFHQWKFFIQSVVDRLVSDHLIDKDDPSIKSYLGQLP